MKRQQKKYERPLRPWDRPRIEAEKKIKQDYGLRRKKEIWKAQAILRNFRRLARELRAKKDKEKENGSRATNNSLERFARCHFDRREKS